MDIEGMALNLAKQITGAMHQLALKSTRKSIRLVEKELVETDAKNSKKLVALSEKLAKLRQDEQQLDCSLEQLAEKIGAKKLSK